MANILVTGGLGFIGSFIVDELVKKGHKVRVFDKLVYQVHRGKLPEHINKKTEIVFGSMTDKEALTKALENIDIVFHKAAEVGVGQSMYEIARYTDANVGGTANLFDCIINNETIKQRIKKIIVAGSMSAYGEGLYADEEHADREKTFEPEVRKAEQLKQKLWEVQCEKTGKTFKGIPTPETKSLNPTSVYAVTKKAQEELALVLGKAYSIPTVVLRYFNVYGPRQSLSNPYTGVAAIFMSRLKNDQPPLVFEDGKQTRDFVSVHDVVQANILAMEKDEANYHAFNVGSGEKISIQKLAETIASVYGKTIAPVITNKYREGDIRHCFADITKIHTLLGFKPQVQLSDGMRELVNWSEAQAAEDFVDKMSGELDKRGLLS